MDDRDLVARPLPQPVAVAIVHVRARLKKELLNERKGVTMKTFTLKAAALLLATSMNSIKMEGIG